VKADVGRVALKRGPLVYCAEQVDNGQTPLDRVRLPRTAKVGTKDRADLFDGIVTIIADGTIAEDWGDDLYRSAPADGKPASVTAVPYYLWNNRQPGAMKVWMPEN
jgi:DUF1680 family protein